MCKLRFVWLQHLDVASSGVISVFFSWRVCINMHEFTPESSLPHLLNYRSSLSIAQE